MIRLIGTTEIDTKPEYKKKSVNISSLTFSLDAVIVLAVLMW